MGRKPNNPPQDLETMTAEMQTAKQNRSPESRLYSRTESLQAVDRKISQIVKGAAEEFRYSQQQAGRLSLSDTGRVADQIELYLSACQSTATLPTLTGLARSLGFSYTAVRNWELSHPQHPTADLIQRYRELCQDVLSDSGLRNATNPVLGIFLLKSCYGLRDALVIETAQPQHPLGAEPDVAEIAERYALLLDDIQETN